MSIWYTVYCYCNCISHSDSCLVNFPNLRLVDVSHSAKPRSKVNEETAKVWTLSANDVLDNDIVSILCDGLVLFMDNYTKCVCMDLKAFGCCSDPSTASVDWGSL